jgi:hypothetical protein
MKHAIRWTWNGLVRLDVLSIFAVLYGLGYAAMLDSRFITAGIFFFLSVAYVAFRILRSEEIQAHRERKEARFLVVGISILVFAISIYWEISTYHEKLEKQETDSENKLSLPNPVIPASGKLIDTKFTIKNGGDLEIGDHIVDCKINALISSHGMGYIRNSGFFQAGSGTSILPGGDGPTVACLSTLPFAVGIKDNEAIDCVDITLRFGYKFKQAHPEKEREKDFRFVATKSADQFSWDQQLIKQEGTYCKAPPTIDEEREKQINALKVQLNRIVSTHSLNVEKTNTAQLALDIFDFADERGKVLPKQPEQIGIHSFPTQLIEEAKKWDEETVERFNSRYGNRLNEIFKRTRHAGVDTKAIESNCYGPNKPIWILQNCAMGIGEISKRMPN